MPKSPKKIAVLTSGGMDSAILIASLLKRKRRIRPIYIQSGHVWERAELAWLKRYLKTVQNRRLNQLAILSAPAADLYPRHWGITGRKIPGLRSRDEEVYLPGKNLILIAKVAVYCALNRIHAVALAPLKSNPFPDARPSFFKKMERVCSEALNHPFQILTPFLDCSKKEVMLMGKTLPLELTFSCLSPKGLLHCGKCNKCAERKKAFRTAGLIDRTRYANRQTD